MELLRTLLYWSRRRILVLPRMLLRLLKWCFTPKGIQFIVTLVALQAGIWALTVRDCWVLSEPYPGQAVRDEVNFNGFILRTPHHADISFVSDEIVSTQPGYLPSSFDVSSFEEGRYRVIVRAYRRLLFWTILSQSIETEIVIDRSKPTIELIGLPPDWITRGEVGLQVRTREGCSVSAYVNGVAWPVRRGETVSDLTIDTTLLQDGMYDLAIHAEDYAGNENDGKWVLVVDNVQFQVGSVEVAPEPARGVVPIQLALEGGHISSCAWQLVNGSRVVAEGEWAVDMGIELDQEVDGRGVSVQSQTQHAVCMLDTREIEDGTYTLVMLVHSQSEERDDASVTLDIDNTQPTLRSNIFFDTITPEGSLYPMFYTSEPVLSSFLTVDGETYGGGGIELEDLPFSHSLILHCGVTDLAGNQTESRVAVEIRRSFAGYVNLAGHQLNNLFSWPSLVESANWLHTPGTEDELVYSEPTSGFRFELVDLSTPAGVFLPRATLPLQFAIRRDNLDFFYFVFPSLSFLSVTERGWGLWSTGIESTLVDRSLLRPYETYLSLGVGRLHMSYATLTGETEKTDGVTYQTWDGTRYSRDWAGIGLCIPLTPNRKQEPTSSGSVVLELLAGVRVWRTADIAYTRELPKGLQHWLMGWGDDTIHDSSVSYDVGPYFEIRFLVPEQVRR